MLNQTLVSLDYGPAVSNETIRKVLKKTQTLAETAVVGTITGAYLANPEDVLDVYSPPAEAGVVRLGFDERPCQLLDHVLTPIPPKPGATQKEHQEYLRKGGCNVLLAYNLDMGQRHLRVTTTKNKGDYARFMDWLMQTYYPDAPKIKLVQDNYSTHCYGAFYELWWSSKNGQ